MKKKYIIADLEGHDLHVAVAITRGFEPSTKPFWIHKDGPTLSLNFGAFALALKNTGALDLVEEFWIGLDRPSRGQTQPVWRALGNYRGDRVLNPMGNVVEMWGPTAAVAAMRCFVGMTYFEMIEMNVPKLQDLK